MKKRKNSINDQRKFNIGSKANIKIFAVYHGATTTNQSLKYGTKWFSKSQATGKKTIPVLLLFLTLAPVILTFSRERTLIIRFSFFPSLLFPYSVRDFGTLKKILIKLRYSSSPTFFPEKIAQWYFYLRTRVPNLMWFLPYVSVSSAILYKKVRPK